MKIKIMKLYLISQKENQGYDTYDAAVVCAPDEDTARNMSPTDGSLMTAEQWPLHGACWCSSANEVSVRYLGEANAGTRRGLMLSSFNAG